MRKIKSLLLLIILVPILCIGQKKRNQKLAEISYNTLISTLDASTDDRRDAFVKTLDGIVELTKDDKFKSKVNKHKSYLESLEYFEIPKANTTLITDSLINAKGLTFEKLENKYYIEPSKAFKQVIKNNKTGIYLYLYINESHQMYLEFVNYTKGQKKLSMNKATLEFGGKKIEYYLNWVKSKENGFEYCTIESNTQNFIDIFQAISIYQGEIKIELLGENGSRTKTLDKEMALEIKNVLDLYSELSIGQ